MKAHKTTLSVRELQKATGGGKVGDTELHHCKSYSMLGMTA